MSISEKKSQTTHLQCLSISRLHLFRAAHEGGLSGLAKCLIKYQRIENLAEVIGILLGLTGFPSFLIHISSDVWSIGANFFVRNLIRSIHYTPLSQSRIRTGSFASDSFSAQSYDSARL